MPTGRVAWSIESHTYFRGALIEKTVRVLLVDDHPSLRSVIRADLEDSGIVVCDEAADAASAVEAAKRERPDVCLLDVSIPGNGLAAAWEISQQLPKTRIVFLTASAENETLVAALQAGAVGYLLKEVRADRLAQEVRRAADGLVSPILAIRMLPELRAVSGPTTFPGAEDLTERQLELLELLQDEPSIEEIGARLGLSEDGVRDEIFTLSRRFRSTVPLEALGSHLRL